MHLRAWALISDDECPWVSVNDREVTLLEIAGLLVANSTGNGLGKPNDDAIVALLGGIALVEEIILRVQL